MDDNSIERAGYINNSATREIYSGISSYIDELRDKYAVFSIDWNKEISRPLKRLFGLSLALYCFENPMDEAKCMSRFGNCLGKLVKNIDGVMNGDRCVLEKRGLYYMLNNAIQYIEQLCILEGHIYNQNIFYLRIKSLLPMLPAY